MKTVTRSKQTKKNRQATESLVLFGLVMVTAVGPFSQAKGLVSLVALVYFLLDKILRKKSWNDVGCKTQTLQHDLKANWLLVLAVAIGTQVLFLVLALSLYPEVLEHILARTPLDFSNLGALVLMLVLGTLAEEVVYRGLLQARLSTMLGNAWAIILVSLVFGIAHYSPGATLLVAFDLVFVILDSLLYGLIFARTNNIGASWLAHLGANSVGLVLVALLKVA